MSRLGTQRLYRLQRALSKCSESSLDCRSPSPLNKFKLRRHIRGNIIWFKTKFAALICTFRTHVSILSPCWQHCKLRDIYNTAYILYHFKAQFSTYTHTRVFAHRISIDEYAFSSRGYVSTLYTYLPKRRLLIFRWKSKYKLLFVLEITCLIDNAELRFSVRSHRTFEMEFESGLVESVRICRLNRLDCRRAYLIKTTTRWILRFWLDSLSTLDEKDCAWRYDKSVDDWVPVLVIRLGNQL